MGLTRALARVLLMLLTPATIHINDIMPFYQKVSGLMAFSPVNGS